jgi:ATP-dependent Clp protease protease subunit
MTYLPIVLEHSGKGDRAWDLFSRLLVDRIIFLGSPIDDNVSNIIIAQLLFLESQDSCKDINLYINSPGGHITAGLGIVDCMQYLRSPVSTICIGQCASMAAVLLACGTQGKRYALPNSRVLLHQPLGGASGQASDIEIEAKEILRMKDVLYKILCKQTGQPMEKIIKDCDRDFILTAEESKTYGLIDEVMAKKS